VVVIRRFAPRRVGFGIVLWAIGVAILFFVNRTPHHLGISGSTAVLAAWAGFALTGAVGFWLGWRRRTGVAFIAPWLSWTLFVPFAFLSEFIRAGFFDGLWRGLGLLVIGGFIAAMIEVVILVLFALAGRVAVASLGGGERSTVILPPGTG
jgi:hypothetical protein